MNKKNIISLFLSFLVFILFINLTSPYKLPLIFIIFPAVPLLIAVLSLTRIIILVLHVNKTLSRFILFFVGLVYAVFFILLSLGQLTFKDFFLLLALGSIGSFYIIRMFKPEKEQ
ncbi:MAG: hypothetical protein WCJ60_01890 [bacterium]